MQWQDYSLAKIPHLDLSPHWVKEHSPPVHSSFSTDQCCATNDLGASLGPRGGGMEGWGGEEGENILCKTYKRAKKNPL